MDADEWAALIIFILAWALLICGIVQAVQGDFGPAIVLLLIWIGISNNAKD